MSKKNNVKKAIESIVSGDARGLRKHVSEALVDKVKKALDKKEQELAKNLIQNIESK
jgi:geranylgeranyl pyrophosphate synthase